MLVFMMSLTPRGPPASDQGCDNQPCVHALRQVMAFTTKDLAGPSSGADMHMQRNQQRQQQQQQQAKARARGGGGAQQVQETSGRVHPRGAAGGEGGGAASQAADVVAALPAHLRTRWGGRFCGGDDCGAGRGGARAPCRPT